MSTDYAAKERAFIASLAEETGRDLQGWLSAIAGCGHSERNDVIDWLRLQGFQFSRASWIERIHHNGGRLIYGGEGDELPAEGAAGTTGRVEAREPMQDSVAAPVQGSSPATPFTTRAATIEGNTEIERLLVSAKGLRPLAEAILAEIQAAAGGCACEADGRLILLFMAGLPVAALSPGPKQIRLYADFGRRPGPRVVRAEPIGKLPAPFPDMISMDDARSIDAEFRACLSAALRAPMSKTA